MTVLTKPETELYTLPPGPGERILAVEPGHHKQPRNSTLNATLQVETAGGKPARQWFQYTETHHRTGQWNSYAVPARQKGGIRLLILIGDELWFTCRHDDKGALFTTVEAALEFGRKWLDRPFADQKVTA